MTMTTMDDDHDDNVDNTIMASPITGKREFKNDDDSKQIKGRQRHKQYYSQMERCKPEMDTKKK